MVSITDNCLKKIEDKKIKEVGEIAKKVRGFIGYWQNAGKHYLDVSILIGDRGEALRIARGYKQIAIWDNAGGREIFC